MIKRLVMAAVMLAILNIGTGLAAQAYDLNRLKSDIAAIEANKAKIILLETSLNGLKIDSRANMWNFLGRSGNEVAIQKRSRIVREISGISDINAGIISGLIKIRAALYTGLAAGLKDEAFRQVLNYCDALAASEALAFDFMASSEISSAGKSKDRAEFLRYKRDMQDIRLKDIETIIRQFKAVAAACQAAKFDDMAASRDKYIKELGDRLAVAQKSQDLMDTLLK